MTCKYADVFGKPNTGIHSHRLLNLAIVDLALTILVCCIIAYVFKFNPGLTILVGLLVGILAHRIFCVNTTINKLIFGHV